MIEMIPHASFVRAEEAFAGIRDVPSGFPFGSDEIHQPAELVVGEEEFGVLSGSSHRVNTENTPVTYSERPEVVADSREAVNGALVDAGDDIKGERDRSPRRGEGIIVVYDLFDSAGGSLEGKGVLAEPDVVLFESVEGDGNGAESGGDEFVKPRFGKRQTVGNHSPRVAPLHEGTPDFGEVFAHKGFAAGNDDEHIAGVVVGGYFGVNDVQKILRGHVGGVDGREAVTTAMEAMNIAPECRFPEELLKRM